MKDNQKIQIAEILKPQGLKGELKCKLKTNDFSIFKKLKEVYVNDEKFEVLSCVLRSGFAYFSLKNVSSIEKAETLRNKNIFADKSLFEEEENSYFIEDLVNCILIDEDGEKAGKVISVEQYGAADILIVNSCGAVFSLAFLDSIFTHVDIRNKTIKINRSEFDKNKV